MAQERWGAQRMYTYIDPAKTKQVRVHGKPCVGWTWRKAGWKPAVRKDGTQIISKAGQWLFVKLPRASGI